jgi:preprotein translocase subunit SecD
MSSSWWTRFWVISASLAVSVVLLLPTVFYNQLEDPTDPETWPSWYRTLERVTGGARITWGLDLQGGLHLQYQVDVDKAIADRMERYAVQLRADLQERHPQAGSSVERVRGEPALVVRATSAGAESLLDAAELLTMHLDLVRQADGSVRLEMDPVYIEETRQYAIEQAMETIRKRIDSSGVVDPSISRRGDRDIIIQLPGLDESRFERVKDIIAQTAQLVFKMVSDDNATFVAGLGAPTAAGIEVRDGTWFASEAEPLLEALSALDTPGGTYLVVEQVERYNAATRTNETLGYRPLLLETASTLTGEYVASAQVGQDPDTGRTVVSMRFDAEGARLFGRLTSQNVGRQMAIVLDNISSSRPVIQGPIMGGQAQITMSSGRSAAQTQAEAESLAIVLRNGALPAPIEKEFETQVGPSLGADSVRRGALSLGVSFVLVALFILYWYKGAGVLTVLALVANVLVIGAVLALFGATLTLPGIAGITLTVGMAVDANVIIFERIREELALGKAAQQAVRLGYEKALSAVLDANVTTAIAGILLLQYGSGPIKGFAVTLLIGIASSLATAIYVTRLGFDYLLEGRKVTRLSI